MKKWFFIVVLVAIATPAMGARQTVVRTDLFGAGWTKQNNMNLELYQKTDPAETGFTGMDGAVITSGNVPSAKSLSPDKTPGVPSVNFLYEANGTDTNGFGFLGPANSTKNILYRISDESPAVGNVFKVDSIATDQTITVGSGSIVADVVTLILAAETGGGGASFVEQADDPTSSSEDGYFYGATTSGDFFYKSSTGLFNITAGTYTADPTTPTLVSITIPPAGTTAEAVFSETMAIGAGGAGGWTLNDPTVAMTRTGGTGTVGDPVIFSLARTVLSTATENPTVSYTQPGNGFESADDGVDLVSITNATVTNNSTQTGSLYTTAFSDAFTRPDNTNVIVDGPGWTSETDTAGIGSILNNAYSIAMNGTNDCRISKTISSNNTDYEIKFKLKLADITAIDNRGLAKISSPLQIYTTAGVFMQIYLRTDTSGNLTQIGVSRYNDAGSVQATVYQSFSFVADTYINFTIQVDVGLSGTSDGVIKVVADSTTILDLTGLSDETRPVATELRLGLPYVDWNQVNTMTIDDVVMGYK